MKQKSPVAEVAKRSLIYQTKSGEIAFRGDLEQGTVWGTQQQIADVFEIDRSVVTKHINKILNDGQVDRKSNVQKMHFAHADKPINLYSLDIILALGYRVNSAKAIIFRIWATKTLKQHLLEGYTINKKRIASNYDQFMAAVAGIQELLPNDGKASAQDTLNLVKAFANAWVSLEAYDSQRFPKNGSTRRKVEFTEAELARSLAAFKEQLVREKQATDLFGKERQRDALSGIVGNLFQTFGGSDLYPSIEEKAANLLYFIVKNHPFIDGNKRSGAFAFIWFLSRAGILSPTLTPEVLATLTLLVAESAPASKDKMIGLVLLLLRDDNDRSNT